MSDALIDRIARGDGTAEDLQRLASATDTSGGSEWEALAAALRAEFTLLRGARAVAAATAAIEPPSVRIVAPSPLRRAWSWSGWIAAVLACAVVAWMAGPGGVPSTLERGPTVQRAGGQDVEDALALYLEAGRASGRVLQQLPAEPLEIRPSSDGNGTEVLYVRRVLERADLDAAYRVAVNEHGQAAFVPLTALEAPLRHSM